jgi:glycine hydroxymethyltransferase
VPLDANGPWYTSGIRLGVAALTTRGMRESEMVTIVDIIVDLLSSAKASFDPITKGLSRANVDVSEKVVEKTKERVKSLLENFPLYPEIVF